MGNSFLSTEASGGHADPGRGGPGKTLRLFATMAVTALSLIAVIWIFAPGEMVTNVAPIVLNESIYCAPSRAGAVRVATIVRNRDILAAAGMLDRREILFLDAATRVRPFYRRDGYSQIEVQTGYHAGQHCWAPNFMLSQ